jgi:hypothetical protein
MSGPDILREVEESLRTEKAIRFWNDHGKTIITIVAVIILATMAQSGWVAFKKNQNEQSTSQFLDTIKTSDPIPSLKKLSAEQNGSGSALSGLTAAAMSVDKKNWTEAIELYRQVSQNKSAPKPYRDLAIIQMVSLQLDHDEKAKGTDLLKSLEDIITDKKSPWQARAIFTSALIKSSKNNDIPSARADLQTLLATPNLPTSFLDQVRSLDEIYKLRQGK